MPRGRPRKPRLSRLDAAVDAMTAFGFPVEKVKKHVKELLKVYGGDEAWPFIEEYSYKELLDALLRDVEGSDQEQVAVDGDQSKKLIEDESAAGTSTRVSEIQQAEGPENISQENIAKSLEFVATSSGINNAKGDENDWKDILQDQHPKHMNETAIVAIKVEEDQEINPPSNTPIPASPSPKCIPSPQPTSSLPPHRRRQPCYGWIDSDEEDVDDLVISVPLPPELCKVPSDGNKSRRKRKSGWDVSPDDPNWP